jgi:serine/threonine protein phosphatase 1
MFTYVIGDIHGMFDNLEELLAILPLDRERDTLAFVGDYIDRGPDSRRVVDRVLALRKSGMRLICLRGNHEEMFLDFLEGQNQELFLYNGGETTLESYGWSGRLKENPVPPEHLEFFRSLEYYRELDEFILVHGGLRPGIPLERQDFHDLCWIRQEFIHSDYDFGKRVVFGHTPFRQPYIDPYKIGIDTGAVYGNRLTCVRLPDLEFFSA